jgi:MFS family permease
MNYTSDNHEPGQLPANKGGFYYGYIIVLCAFIGMVAILSLPFSYGIFFKPMATELSWNRTVTSGAYSLSLIVAGLVSIAMGWLIDKMGARIVLVFCGVFSGIGFLLLSRIDAVWELFLVYGIIIGASTSIFSPMVATVAKWFIRRRTLMTGIVISGVGVATLIGPPIANMLISIYGWRLSYVITGVILAIVAIVAAQFMRRDPQQIGQVALGATDDEEESVKSQNDAFSLRQAACTRQFWIFFVMSICYSFCYMSTIVHIAPYITDLGISSTAAANVMATIGGATILGMVVMGNAGDRIGNEKTIIIGWALMSLAMVLLLFIKEAWLFYLFAVLFGLAFAGISSQRPPIVAMMFGVRSHGLIFGAIDNSYTIGAAVGPVLDGYIFDATGSYLFAFLASAAIAVCGLILSISLRPIITGTR